MSLTSEEREAIGSGIVHRSDSSRAAYFESKAHELLSENANLKAEVSQLKETIARVIADRDRIKDETVALVDLRDAVDKAVRRTVKKRCVSCGCPNDYQNCDLCYGCQ